MADGIEKLHVTRPEQQDLHDRENDVNGPQSLGRLLDLGMQLIRNGSGHLGHEQLHAAHPEQGQYGQGHHDDPHAPEPLGQAPPEKESV
jgi:hypothetical protein